MTVSAPRENGRRSDERALRPRALCLIRPPYFTPWSPPLGIALLKSFLEQRGHQVTCIDLNVDREIWACQREYFSILQSIQDNAAAEGHSKLWFLFSAHQLAFLNCSNPRTVLRAVQRLAPIYAIHCDEPTAAALSQVILRLFSRLSHLVERHDCSQFWAVGTSTYSTSLAASLFLLQKIKNNAPNVRTVMGGGVFFDDLALGSDNLTVLVDEFPFVDHAVLGEGELLFTRLIEGDLDGRRIVTLADLKDDSLDIQHVPVPDFADFDLDLYFHLTIEGGRSCPFQCTFCSETVQWGTYRKKTKSLLADQIVALANRFNNNRFFMADSLMNPYIEGFSGELLERGANILYDGYLRADTLASAPERVQRWSRSGCFRVRLGVETASAKLLKLMDKRTTPQVISSALKALAGAGIRTTTYWIVGHPGETREDFEETLEFIREHRDVIYELEAHPFYYYPYGQVASRRYSSISAHPEEVTSLIRFREWDIVDCDPPREERFRRLRIISQAAYDLGIPNIYSMKDRYAAEERWFNLHREAVEAY